MSGSDDRRTEVATLSILRYQNVDALKNFAMIMQDGKIISSPLEVRFDDPQESLFSRSSLRLDFELAGRSYRIVVDRQGNVLQPHGNVISLTRQGKADVIVHETGFSLLSSNSEDEITTENEVSQSRGSPKSGSRPIQQLDCTTWSWSNLNAETAGLPIASAVRPSPRPINQMASTSPVVHNDSVQPINVDTTLREECRQKNAVSQITYPPLFAGSSGVTYCYCAHGRAITLGRLITDEKC